MFLAIPNTSSITVANTCGHVSKHLILKATLDGRHYYFPLTFSNKKTGTQRHSFSPNHIYLVELEGKSKQLDCGAHDLNYYIVLPHGMSVKGQYIRR